MTSLEVARFGNRANAHSILDHSGLAPGFLGPLVWRTDAPPDGGDYHLEPFVAAYRYADTYVVQATKKDTEAVRAGMVLTTVAVVPMDELPHLDIVAMWQKLLDEDVSPRVALDSADFALAVAGPHEHPPGARAAASALLKFERVVWTGPGFEEFVRCLWTHLRTEDRKRLVVAAAAHPDRIPVQPEDGSLLVVRTAVGALGRWSGWTAVSSDAPTPADPVRDALYSDDGGRSQDMADRLGVTYVPFKLLRLLANAADLFGELESLNHLQCRGLLQLLGAIQPDPTEGVVEKEQVIGRMAALTVEATLIDIQALRTFPEAAVRSGARLELLDAWAALIGADPTRSGDVFEAIVHIAEAPNDDYLDGVAACIGGRLGDDNLRRVVKQALGDPRGEAFLTYVAGNMRDTNVIDGVIADVIDAEAEFAIRGWLADLAHAKGMAATHARAVSTTDPVSAWRAHLDLKPRNVAAEDILARRVGDAGVVEAALNLTDAKLLARAAKAAASDPTLLKGVPVINPRFLAIWLASVALGADPWGSVRPADVADHVLSAVVGGSPVPDAVIVALSTTTSADISEFPRRADLWDKLPRAAVSGFKSATAASFARSYAIGDQAPERPLDSEVLSPSVLESVARETPAQAITLLNLPTATASHAILIARVTTLTNTDSRALGTVVVSRRWKSAAETIMDMSAGRADLRHAAHKADELLSGWDRIRRALTSGGAHTPRISQTDLQTTTVDVAARLYPAGPVTGDIWQRAGGDEADLPTGRTGREVWGKSIEWCFAERSGAPSVLDLVSTMLDEYPKNHDLEALKVAIENGASK